MRTWLARTGLVLLAATASLGLGACAEERDPINKVQPNVLPKSFFLGQDLQDPKDDPEFRMKSFVVDAAVSQSGYGIGEFGAVDRIRWEVTENMLIGRRAYQESPGQDAHGVPNGQVPGNPDKNVTSVANGTIVAAYAIASHFDIRRSYNPQTGEEQNVLEENTTDRPWNLREYMRVDWSKNLAEGSTNDAWFGYGKATPVAYNVTDPKSDDAPHIEVDNGYLDVTNKFTVEPDMIQFSWGEIPRCALVSFFTGSSTYDCTPQEATTRTSFAKVQPDEDFEAFEDNKAWLDVVGNTGGEGDGRSGSILGSARTTWDPQYGWQDSATHRLKSIHNIWQKSHQAATCGSNVDDDHDGTADECSNAKTGYTGSKGSQCDVLANKCTLPVRDRQIKTIAYHLNKEAPDAFQDKVDGSGKVIEGGTLEQMGIAWNQMISVATAYRREVECRRTGDGDRDSCHAQFFDSDDTPASKQAVAVGGWLTDKPKALPLDQGAPSFYVCHNPVRAYDAAACGKAGDTSRFGDIRKNHLVYWPYESRAHYGGVGWNPPDPVTGETHGASATIMGRSVTRAAAMQRDIIQVAMGDTTMEDIISGVPAERYQRTLRDGASAPEAFRTGKTPEQIAAKIGAVDIDSLHASIAVRPAPASMSAFNIAKMETVSKSKSMVDAKQFLAGVDKYQALASKLKGSVAGLDDIATPMAGYEPAKIEAMKSWFENDMAAHGACFNEASSMGTGSLYLASLAGYFKTKYADLDPKTRGERIYDDLVKETIKGIGLHEIGHSLGLRHNFASSWDAPNYDPQYWQLRTNEGKSTAVCKDARKGGTDDSCMGPRYLDPMTADEQGMAGESRPGIDYYANTSTMEYQIERGGESIGLGNYDQHAMKALYGRVLEAIDERQIPTAQHAGLGLKNFTQLQEKDIIRNGNSFFAHYTQTARLLKVFDPQRDCRDATPEEIKTNGWRIVHGKVCAPSPKDHASWDDYVTDGHPMAPDLSLPKWHAKTPDGKEVVRWNYRYGEQYGQGGYMHTTMMDAGADVYELTQNLARSFELRYPFTYFRRGDREWVGEFLPQSVASQYFSRLRAYHWQVALDISRSTSGDLANDDSARPYVMAQAEMFNMLTRAALMPEPGNYAPSKRGATGGKTIFDLGDSTSPIAGGFTVGIGDGRFIALDFENDKGGSWGYQKFWHHAGFETEKSLAMMQLVDPRPTLFTVARENYLDGRDVFINFRNDLGTGVDRLLGGLLAEDWESIAPHVVGDASSGLQAFDLAERSLTRPQNAEIVFPNIGYKQQLSMAIYGTLFSRLASDMTLANKMRIWADGDKAPTVPGTREIRFTNPESGYVYIASKYGDETVDGKTVDKGIGSRVLQRANALLADAYQVKTDDKGKPMVDDKGQWVLATDASGKPIEKSPDGILALRRYVGIIDSMRQIGRILDGPLGGASGGSDDE